MTWDQILTWLIIPGGVALIVGVGSLIAVRFIP
jgi:hypothetical protein